MPDNLLIAIAALGNLLFPDFCPMSLFPQPVRGLHRQGDQSPDVPQPINLYIPKTHLLSLSLKIFSKLLKYKYYSLLYILFIHVSQCLLQHGKVMTIEFHVCHTTFMQNICMYSLVCVSWTCCETRLTQGG